MLFGISGIDFAPLYDFSIGTVPTMVKKKIIFFVLNIPRYLVLL